MAAKANPTTVAEISDITAPTTQETMGMRAIIHRDGGFGLILLIPRSRSLTSGVLVVAGVKGGFDSGVPPGIVRGLTPGLNQTGGVRMPEEDGDGAGWGRKLVRDRMRFKEARREQMRKRPPTRRRAQ
jgi:hypothetical protein